MRKCFICGSTKDIEESHDVPCYLFIDFERRNNKKNRADKLGRHLLCIQHHKEYEQALNLLLKTTAKNFAHSYLKKEDDTKAITKP